jgi:Zn-dependent peptidase ImmA (M78 family)
MSASSTSDQYANRISEAIAAMYDTAEIEADFETPRITPLDRLIAAHSLRRDEIPNLTRRRATAAIAAMSGQEIATPTDADVALAGFLYAWPYRNAVWGCLLVEQNDIVERRRFSAAHELGHYMLHFRPAIQTEREHGRRLTMVEGLSYRDQSDDTEAALPTGASSYAHDADTQGATLVDDVARMEDEANQFAAELLMPKAACQALAQHYGRRASSRRLATEFLVSMAAMHWRLRQLGLAS